LRCKIAVCPRRIIPVSIIGLGSAVYFQPRFFSGRSLFGALGLTTESDGLKVWSAFESVIVFEAASNFDSSRVFRAAFALLLNLFFSFAIVYSLSPF
jgi:hypothetical protein